MKIFIGRKKQMSQIFAEDGQVVPVTKIVAEPCFVIGKKEYENHVSVQVAGLESKVKNVNKPLKKFFQKVLNKEVGYKKVKEFKMTKDDAMFEKLNIGQVLDISMFSVGEKVDVQGISKGKGFQGVVKRHGFHGSLATHGHKDQVRMPGSIGATGPQRVFKGTRMGGHMGDCTCTIKNIEIAKVDPELGELFIKGAVPGATNSILFFVGQGDFDIVEIKKQPEQESVQETEQKIVAQEVATENNDLPAQEIKQNEILNNNNEVTSEAKKTDVENKDKPEDKKAEDENKS